MSISAFELSRMARSHGLELVAIQTPNGHQLRVEIADTPSSRTQGLSGRDVLDVDGLLLVWPAADEHPIWMAGMRFGLDIVWLDEQGQALAVVRGAEPCSSDPCPILRPPNANRTISVLETHSGRAVDYGLEIGARIVVALPDSLSQVPERREHRSLRMLANVAR